MKKRSATRVPRRATVLVLALAWLAASPPARAADPPYLEQMPSVERVRADVQGSDRHDTLARQKAAFEQLARAIDLVAGPRRFSSGLTADEQRWLTAYRGAADAVRREAYAGLSNDPPGGLNPFARSPLQQWNALEGEYARDAAGREALFARYFASEARAALDAAFAAADGDEPAAPGRLAELGPGNQLFVRVLVYGMLAAIPLALLREWLPFGASRRDPLTLRAGFWRRRLGWTTGHVTDYKTWTSTEVVRESVTLKNMDGTVTHGSSEGRVTRTYVHEQFALATGGGEPHHVHLTDADIKIPDGHLATAVWAQASGGQRGAHVLFFDRSDSRTRPVPAIFEQLFKVSRWMYLPIVAPAFLIGDVAGLAGGGVSGLVGGLLAAFVAYVVARIAFHYVGVRRLRRFIANDGPRILAAIDRSDPTAAALVTRAVP